MLSHEKLNANEDAGIKKITRKMSAPIKPKIFERFKKKIFPKTPPLLLSK